MKLDRPLSPSLGQIERLLFGVSPALIEAVSRGETSKTIADSVRRSTEWAERSEGIGVEPSEPESDESAGVFSALPMPDHLRDLIERRIAAKVAMLLEARPVPESGQIVEVRQIETPRPGQIDWVIQAPLYVLLDAPAECDTVWHGWLASGETDYAGWWDFLLQEEDGPFEPEAGVVHVWNPVRIYLPMAGRVVGMLQPARLQALRALAAEYVTGDIPEGTPIWLGRVATRLTLAGLPIVTGSPLGGDEDPRHRYQHLYFHAADAIRAPARLALAASVRVLNPIGALVDRMIAAASRAGQILAPVPRVAHAMSRRIAERDDSEITPAIREQGATHAINENNTKEDLVWDNVARISILQIETDGSGRLSVKAVGDIAITCERHASGVLEHKITIRPGDEAASIDWEGGEPVTLTLLTHDGRSLDLPLVR